ncbi:Sly41p KNAG_0G03170 [Huiozyma naganishii CBS 8797]|uniref:Sugar phosphate transporter domain-containing protein n=1 Tax=Huiozyma naganishii (strain ATCC MYA-139 / BCRC 22969 / CBS 8797 / KCTC 17520 / NBRC 10181 / NCYC 3082 / Yp74L-3) TaxID=1071383 RepID=J7S865_HUIN7|nr:hypothetical protein KNAG_0G03170 [Kazachstania naganishii CBS 8797]CCK71374.1 hypothetical protein KNAG_0G03170 [Kazachstania naganishii CBS 8797]
MSEVEYLSASSKRSTRLRLSQHKIVFDPHSNVEAALEEKGPSARVAARHGDCVQRPYILALVRDFSRFRKVYLFRIDHKVIGLCLCWYLASSISSNVSKVILKQFKHPVALTEIQFLLSAALCLSFVSLVNLVQDPKYRQSFISQSMGNFPKGMLPNYLDGDFKHSIMGKFLSPSTLLLTTTFPLGIFQFLGHLMTHKATALIPISLVHSVKAVSPIATVLYYRFVTKKNFNKMTYYTLLLLISGVTLTCWATSTQNKTKTVSEPSASIFFGLFFAFMSMAIFVTQNIFAKGMLTVSEDKNGILSGPNTSKVAQTVGGRIFSPVQLDKITILFYCSCIGFLLTLFPFLTNELYHGTKVINDLTWRVIGLILFHSVMHFVQAMLAFQLIGTLSSLNYSVANIIKRIVTIVVAVVWESKVNCLQFLGLLMTLTGLYGYDKWGKSRK